MHNVFYIKPFHIICLALRSITVIQNAYGAILFGFLDLSFKRGKRNGQIVMSVKLFETLSDYYT